MAEGGLRPNPFSAREPMACTRQPFHLTLRHFLRGIFWTISHRYLIVLTLVGLSAWLSARNTHMGGEDFGHGVHHGADVASRL